MSSLFSHACRLFVSSSWGFLGGSVVKNPLANVGDAGSIPESRRFPWRRKWQSTSVFLPGEFMDRGAWWYKDSETNEPLNTQGVIWGKLKAE